MKPGVLVPAPPENEFPPEGIHHGVLVDVLGRDLATRTGVIPAVDLVFQVETRKRNGRRFLVKRTCPRSLHRTSSLRRLLEVWRTQQFTDDELQPGLVLDTWLGRSAKLLISHRPPKAGFRTPLVLIEEVLPADAGVFVTPEAYIRVRDRRPVVVREGIAVTLAKRGGDDERDDDAGPGPA